jgi:hypothetical protein
MTTRLIRLLCLGCGLLLGLPPAWCCWTPPLTSAPQAEPEHASCCSERPSPKPVPSQPPVRCPCDDRNTVTPAGPEKVAADLSLPAPLAVAPTDSARAGPDAGMAPLPPVLLPPLHVRQCVWLC